MATNNAIDNTLPTPFTVGATSVTSTGTQLNYLNALTAVPINKISIQRVTATGAGTYTPTAGMVFVIVQAQAAGAGSGGAATAAGSQFAMSQGGGGGEYIEALFTAANIGASKGYSVGAGGAGGAAGANNGNAGGDTTFNTTWIVAKGAAQPGGGASSGANQVFQAESAGGNGGSVATGTLLRQIPGGQSTVAVAFNSQGLISNGGISASCAQSTGTGVITSTAVAGVAAPANSGAGASGAATFNGGTQQAGAKGGDGYINFIEFLSA